MPENEGIGGGNPFAGGGAPSGGESSEGGNPFAGGGESSEGGNPFAGGGESSEGGNPFAGGEESSEGGNPFAGEDGEVPESPWDELLQFEEFDSVEDILNDEGEVTSDSEGGNPFAGGGESSEGGNPFASGGNPFAGGGESSEGGNPFAGGGESEGEATESPWDELLQFEEFDSVEDILNDEGEVTSDSEGGNPFAGGGESSEGGNPFAGGGESSEGGNPFAGGGNPFAGGGESSEGGNPFAGGGNPFAGGGESEGEVTSDSDGEAIPEYDFSGFGDSDEESAAPESFAESPVGDLLNFPGVESEEDIFETFNDDSENALANWNPFTDGNPFVEGDENTDEPVLNADGDTIVVENQFGYILQNAENQFYISDNDLIDEGDVQLGEDNGFSEGFPFSEDDISGAGEVPEFENIPFEGEELAIETDNDAYLLRDGEGNWVVSQDEMVSSEDISLGSSFVAGDNPFLEDSNSLSDLLSSLMETSSTEG